MLIIKHIHTHTHITRALLKSGSDFTMQSKDGVRFKIHIGIFYIFIIDVLS